MFGLGGPARPKAVAFDVIGTMFPLAPLCPALVALGLPPTALEGWFAAGCRDAFAMAVTGDFAPFTQVLDAALVQVLAEHGLDAGAHDRKAMVERLQTLDAREGARDALVLLRDAEVPVMALSNGARDATAQLLRRAGLDDLVRHVVSVEEVKLAKPRPEVYRHAADIAGVPPGDLALVAVHPWDIHGAAAVGLVTAYLTADRPYSAVMREPDLQAGSLPDLARGLAEL